MGSSCSWKTVVEEIKKCRVLCANCHRLKTHENKEYININVFYFKNPLVGLEKIEYNSLSYENSEEWILGQGLESEYNA